MERINKPIIQRAGNDTVYGNGIDEDVVIPSGTTVTITSDMYYNSLNIQSGGILLTNGYRVFVKETLTINGHMGIGSVSGGVIGETASAISDGTLKGQSPISYRAGGQGGGAVDPNIFTLPSFLFKDINVMSGGIFKDPSLGPVAIGGGSTGTTGSSGANGANGTSAILTNNDSWPGKAGSVGSDGLTGNTGLANPNATTAGVPGGRGNTGSPGNVTGMTAGLGGAGGAGGSGGSGGLGGGIVCIVAKNIIGSGTIMSIGRSGSSGGAGSAGSPGTTGNAGTAGSPGSKAPDLAYHVAPIHVPTPATHNPSHHHGGVVFSDFHAHGVNPHPHIAAQHTAASGKTPAHHAPAQHHNSGHYHHTGARHHPHAGDGFGGMHFYAFSGTSGSFYKANGAYQHSHPATFGSFHGTIEHLHAGGAFPGHTTRGHGRVGHTHAHTNGNDLNTNNARNGGGMDSSGGHHHGPHTYSDGLLNANRWSHHTNPDTAVAQPNGHWTGGAGGAGGAAAPAQTGSSGQPGSSGKRGGAGGGGAILIVCDTISSETIQYNTSSGLLSDEDNYSASSGSTYILINL